MFSSTPFATGFPMPLRSELELCVPSVPGLRHAREYGVGDRLAIFDTKLIVATTRSSSPGVPSCCLIDMILDLLIDSQWLLEKMEKLIMLNKQTESERT